MRPFSVSGKLALVTGATRGIGLGAARVLTEFGAHLVLAGRHLSELERVANELPSLDGRIHLAPIDLQHVSEVSNRLSHCVLTLACPIFSINAVAPGYVDTPLNAELVSNPEFSSWVVSRCPMGQSGTPEDIARPIVFLSSPASRFITGQIILVDGGWLSTF